MTEREFSGDKLVEITDEKETEVPFIEGKIISVPTTIRKPGQVRGDTISFEVRGSYGEKTIVIDNPPFTLNQGDYVRLYGPRLEKTERITGGVFAIQAGKDSTGGPIIARQFMYDYKNRKFVKR